MTQVIFQATEFADEGAFMVGFSTDELAEAFGYDTDCYISPASAAELWQALSDHGVGFEVRPAIAEVMFEGGGR